MSDPLEYACPSCMSQPGEPCTLAHTGGARPPHPSRKLQATQDLKRGSHYRQGGMEVLDIWEAFDLDRYMAIVVKYALRAGKKTEDRLGDLEKLRDYAQRAVDEEYRRRGRDAPVQFDVPEAQQACAKDGDLPPCSCGEVPLWTSCVGPPTSHSIRCKCGNETARYDAQDAAMASWGEIR